MINVLLLQGANMNWLGKREPEIYGTTTAAALDSQLRAYAEARGFAPTQAGRRGRRAQA